MNYHRENAKFYTVKSGETLIMIANLFGIEVGDLRAANPHLNEYNLSPGELIIIPERKMDLIPGSLPVNREILELNNAFRMLWEQHIVWTRIVISDIVFENPELDFAIARLLQNPEDFGAQLAKFYGAAFGREFASLMRDHLTIAAELVQAALSGDNQKFAELNRSWFQNADAMSRALASVNPYWGYKRWREMFGEHLNLVLEEATLFIENRLEENVRLFDKMERQALMMADFMTRGIVSQFFCNFCA